MASQIIPFPQELSPRLPTIVGNVDYLTLRERLEQIDTLLRTSGAEREFVRRALENWNPGGKPVTARQQLKFQQRSRRALRCTLLRTLLQEDYRGFSCQLAGNPLYQWFCLVAAIDQVQVPSKSEVQRFAHWLPAAPMRAVIDGLLKGAIDQPRALGLQEALDLEAYFLDSTCLQANIHFPTDWVLLRDGVRTLMKATLLIRKAGLCARMEPPEAFLRRMNRLSIEMSQQARRAGRKKGRKRVGAVATDRGFASAANSRALANSVTFDALCPRQPAELSRKMKDQKFAQLQRRRAQTEARISILKHGFLGRPLRAKTFAHRELALAWAVLTHNLWRLARMTKTKQKAVPLPKAA